MSRGVLVAFEGVDGSGKSTQARRLAERRGALYTYEPGGTELGAELRRRVLDVEAPMHPRTEALLMLGDRSHHVHQVIEPALASGRSVVCDRYFGSTLAYQGYGRGVDLGLLREASELAVDGCWPAMTILLDVSMAVVNDRQAHDRRDRFEAEGLSFHEKVRQGYLTLARELGWVVLDGAGDEEAVSRAVEDAAAALAW